MQNSINKRLIELTKLEFQPYYKAELSDDTANEIINNFTGFLNVLMEMNERRKELQKGEENDSK